MIRYSFVLLMGIFFGRQWTLLSMEQLLHPTFAAGDVEDAPVVKQENAPVISTDSKVSSTLPADIMQATSQVTGDVPVEDAPVVKKQNAPVISTDSKVSSTAPADIIQATSQPVVRKENAPVVSTDSKVSSTAPAEIMQATSQVTQTYNTTNHHHNATKSQRKLHPPSYFIKKIVDISDFQAEIDRRKPNWQREAAKEVLHEPVKIYDGVVHVTKIHSKGNGRGTINQMLCLNKAAYNHRRNYPWVIFHTLPIPEKDMAEAKAIAAPANVTFVRDSPPLEEVVGNFSVEEQQHLFDRCQCCNPRDENSCCKDPSKNVDWDFWW
jgi:hypothetical protein